MQHLIQQRLLRAEDRTKRQADKCRSERQFKVGDQVYLKLQPYVQSPVASRSNKKLAFKFFGPFLILEGIGAVAYKLQLPAVTSIHPVFHVSQLKAAPPMGLQVSPSLPDIPNHYQILECVLHKRLIST